MQKSRYDHRHSATTSSTYSTVVQTMFLCVHTVDVFVHVSQSEAIILCSSTDHIQYWQFWHYLFRSALNRGVGLFEDGVTDPETWRSGIKLCWYIQKLCLFEQLNPLNPELNPICYLLALLGAHHFLHVSRIRVKLLTFTRLMSYIYGAPILDVSRSHTTTQHSR